MEIGGAGIGDPGTRRALAGGVGHGEALGASLAWLASGARALDWVLRSLPRARWCEAPPRERQPFLGDWCAARHVRHLALYESVYALPAIRAAATHLKSSTDPNGFERQDAAWTAAGADDMAVETWVGDLAAARHTMLALAEAAPDRAWTAKRQDAPGLAWLIGRSHQHELDHLASLWRLVLYWDRPLDHPGHVPSGLPVQSPDLHRGTPPRTLAPMQPSRTH